MDKEVEIFEKFLNEEDRKIMEIVIKDQTAFEVIKKLFEDPENAEKYLILIKDNPHAVAIAAKLSESISRYLEGEEEDMCMRIFLRSLAFLGEFRDRKIPYDVFKIVKEAIDERIAIKKYESAAKLVNLFYNLGFKNYVKKLIFHAMEVSDVGDHSRAIRILNLLPFSEEVKMTKSYILVEWGKKLAASDPELALKKIEEALKIHEVPSAKLVMAEIFENLGNYPKAYEIYKSISDQPGIEKRLARLLMEWGEEEKDIRKLEEAKNLALCDPVLLEEIERRIRKIKS
ncbi:MAG: hypothetical protein QXK03_03780 [Archaeoglobaceae archaeon]